MSTKCVATKCVATKCVATKCVATSEVHDVPVLSTVNTEIV